MNDDTVKPRTSNRVFEHHLHAIDTADLTKTPGFRPEIRYEFLPDIYEPVEKLSVTYTLEDGSTTSVELETTRPNFGGTRYWFRCPHCGRRKRKLYAYSEPGNFPNGRVCCNSGTGNQCFSKYLLV